MIYIATHKKFDTPKFENYIPLQVGAEGKEALGYLKDNTGDNISKMNPNFCELTGLYWIWKNCDDEYKGLVHYRRYFGKNNLSSKISDIYTYNELIEMLKNADVILPYVEHFKENTKEEILRECCTSEIFEKMENIIREKYPEYIEAFRDYFSQNKTVLFNMLFCRKELFDLYCEWLFDVLFALEKKVDISLLNSYQKRLYGFLSERLFNVWIKYHNLTVKNVSIINTDMKFGQRLTLVRRRLTNQIRYNIYNK